MPGRSLLLLGFIAISPLTIIPRHLAGGDPDSADCRSVAGRPGLPWIPARFLKIEFPARALLKGIEIADPYVCQVDRFLKPRLAFLTSPLVAPFVALICIAAARSPFRSASFRSGRSCRALPC
ncbi:MAG: exopolysaccharide biosynthesis protein [Hyphomonas sp.]